MPDTERCPACDLPLVWVPDRSAHLRGYRCVGADRHAQLDRMHRAASACFAAGYADEGERISADIDRLRGGRASTAAA